MWSNYKVFHTKRCKENRTQFLVLRIQMVFKKKIKTCISLENKHRNYIRYTTQLVAMSKMDAEEKALNCLKAFLPDWSWRHDLESRLKKTYKQFTFIKERFTI